MSSKNPQVEGFFKNARQWQQELESLRAIVLACGLSETLKWGKPCYTQAGHNIVILQPFKDSCALMFFQGVLLKDPEGILEKPGENSQSARRIMFTSVAQVKKRKSAISAYIQQAIEVAESGKKVQTKKQPEPIPEELAVKFKASPKLKQAFESLTPGRQRAYILHFSGAKQSTTRTSRIEKCTPRILAGKGLHD